MSPDGINFQYVSPRLVVLRFGNTLVLCGTLCGTIPTLVPIADAPALWWLMSVPVAIVLFYLRLVSAQARILRCALADTDFATRCGIFSCSLTLMPYGYIQYVNICQGLTPRLFSTSMVKLSATSVRADATLSGVPVTDVVRLRDALTKHGSAELMGL